MAARCGEPDRHGGRLDRPRAGTVAPASVAADAAAAATTAEDGDEHDEDHRESQSGSNQQGSAREWHV
jgi:hypothetical protein